VRRAKNLPSAVCTRRFRRRWRRERRRRTRQRWAPSRGQQPRSQEPRSRRWWTSAGMECVTRASVPKQHMLSHVASSHLGWDGDGAHVADPARGAAGGGKIGVAVVALAVRVLDDVREVAGAPAQVMPDRVSPAMRRGACQRARGDLAGHGWRKRENAPVHGSHLRAQVAGEHGRQRAVGGRARARSIGEGVLRVVTSAEPVSAHMVSLPPALAALCRTCQM
jgi:hypothetical protein